MQYSLTLLKRIQNKRDGIIDQPKYKINKFDKEIILPMKDTINWNCSCGSGFHHYFITCSECGKENPLDGKGNKI